MGAKCVPLFDDLFIYLYMTDVIQGLTRKTENKLAGSFNFTFHYINDGLSLKIKFEDSKG